MGNSTSTPAQHKATLASTEVASKKDINKTQILNHSSRKESMSTLTQSTSEETRGTAEEPVSKCPMNVGGRSFLGSWRKHHPPINSKNNEQISEKSQLSEEERSRTLSEGNDNDEKKELVYTSKCPVKHEEREEGGFFGLWKFKDQSFKNDKASSEKVQYNVYSQPIKMNPDNNIPINTVQNQLPSSGQKEDLSIERVKSTIPKGGTDNDKTTWTYPSPQMFYNSLARKNKLNDTDESEIPMIVHIHNHMNEKTWNTILQWESLNNDNQLKSSKSTTSKLLKFQGRPTDLSPKAAFKHYILGHPLPFDRHDWYVESSNNDPSSSNSDLRRYVIDYYYQETDSPDDNNIDEDKSILIDVRPAIDSFSTLFDRCYTMPYARYSNLTTFTPLPLLPTKELKLELNESLRVWETNSNKELFIKDESQPATTSLSKKEALALTKSFMEAVKKCESYNTEDSSNSNDDDTDALKKSIATNTCLAKFVCPFQHGTVVKVLQENEDDMNKVDLAVQNMSLCVQERREEVKSIISGLNSEEQQCLLKENGIVPQNTN